MAAPWEQTYKEWLTDPTPDRLNQVVTSIEPVLNQSLARMAAHTDPLMKAKARVLAAEAVKTWDPVHGASLPTWTSNQMVQLHRFRRNTSQVLPIPEGVQLDALKIDSARKRFVDEHGQDPDDNELADAAQLSRKRIHDVMKNTRQVPSASALNPDASSVHSMADHTGEALDAVYDSSDKVDRVILEGRLGYGGRQPMTTLQLLKKTKLTPPQLARRVTNATMRVQRIMSDLEGLYST